MEVGEGGGVKGGEGGGGSQEAGVNLKYPNTRQNYT